MLGQLEMFAQNIRLLIGILLVLAVGGALVLALWTGVKIWLFRRRQQEAALKANLARFGPDGRALPPRGSGVCDACQAAPLWVYHLPDGRRMCESCYCLSQIHTTH